MPVCAGNILQHLTRQMFSRDVFFFFFNVCVMHDSVLQLVHNRIGYEISYHGIVFLGLIGDLFFCFVFILLTWFLINKTILV